MKPDKNATEVYRFRNPDAANEFVAWLYRNQLKPGETARVFANYPKHNVQSVVYVLGRKGAKISEGRVAVMQAAANAFRWAWTLQEGNYAKLRYAFLDILDGRRPDEIESMTGLSPARCEEIGRLHGELLAKYQSAWLAESAKRD